MSLTRRNFFKVASYGLIFGATFKGVSYVRGSLSADSDKEQYQNNLGVSETVANDIHNNVRTRTSNEAGVTAGVVAAGLTFLGNEP